MKVGITVPKRITENGGEGIIIISTAASREQIGDVIVDTVPCRFGSHPLLHG